MKTRSQQNLEALEQVLSNWDTMLAIHKIIEANVRDSGLASMACDGLTDISFGHLSSTIQRLLELAKKAESQSDELVNAWYVVGAVQGAFFKYDTKEE